MQGLAFARGAPLIGVSALDALAAIGGAQLAGPADRVATWVDAWRGEVYAALYGREGELEPPAVEPPGAILARLRGPVLFIGDGAAAHADVIEEALGADATLAAPPAPLLAGT